MEEGVFSMYGKVISACLHGIEGRLVEVEIDVSNGLPITQIVGLPDSAVKEAMERVRAAIKNSGFQFPLQRITVNLAPADLRKEGSAFDLAIALALLATSGQMDAALLQDVIIIGELSLDGSVRPVPGVLSMLSAARASGLRKMIVPQPNAEEASWLSGCEVLALTHISQLTGIKEPEDLARLAFLPNGSPFAAIALAAEGASADYADVHGQQQAKRALTISAAGMHNIMLAGPPGTGKTMLARRLPTIMLPMSEQEALEVTKIYSVSGKFADRRQLVRERPFRLPHHTISAAGLVGGGGLPKPGEVSLAHRGVLFLDELPEFSRLALEVLRQPMEDRQVTLARARAVYTFPAHFLLAASMNPCACGFYGYETAQQSCLCSPLQLARYRSKISGPLLDRIDLHIQVPRVNYQSLSQETRPLSSADMRAQVEAAHEMQRSRFRGETMRFNSELSGQRLRRQVRLDAPSAALLERSFEQLGLSMRAHDRILKLARTIADLEQSGEVALAHVAEALQYRFLDKTTPTATRKL